MSGVWIFKDGVARLEPKMVEDGTAPCKKALVHTPSGQTVASHEALQRCLQQLGWERYYEDPAFVQFHRRIDLISLPADFVARVCAVHMHDIVVKNPGSFRVVDAA